MKVQIASTISKLSALHHSKISGFLLTSPLRTHLNSWCTSYFLSYKLSGIGKEIKWSANFELLRKLFGRKTRKDPTKHNNNPPPKKKWLDGKGASRPLCSTIWIDELFFGSSLDSNWAPELFKLGIKLFFRSSSGSIRTPELVKVQNSHIWDKKQIFFILWGTCEFFSAFLEKKVKTKLPSKSLFSSREEVSSTRSEILIHWLGELRIGWIF